MKKVISLILCLCMVVSMLPSFTLAVSAANEPKTLEYIFSTKSYGIEEDLSRISNYAQDTAVVGDDAYVANTYSFARYDTDEKWANVGTSPWRMDGHLRLTGATLSVTELYLGAQLSRVNSGEVSTALLINITQPGTYTPVLTYEANDGGQIFDIHIVKKPEGKNYGFYTDAGVSTGTSTLYNDLNKLYGETYKVGTVDMFEAVADNEKEKARLGAITVTEPGEYYVIFESAGVNEAFTRAATYTYLYSLSLYPQKIYTYNFRNSAYGATSELSMYTPGLSSGGYDTDNSALPAEYDINSVTLARLDYNEVFATSGSAPWRFDGHYYTDANIKLRSDSLYFNTQKGWQASAPQYGHVALVIKIDEPGTYTPKLSFGATERGAKYDVHLVKKTEDKGYGVFESKTSWKGSNKLYNDLDSYGDTYKIGTVDMYKENTKYSEPVLSERELSPITVTEADVGEYYLLLENVGMQNANNVSYTYLYSLELSDSSGENEPKFIISLRGLDEGETVPLSSIRRIEYGITDSLGLPLDGISKEDVEIRYSSSNTTVATVSEDGILEAVGEGNATITATLTCGDEIQLTDTYELTVGLKGENLLEGKNPDFEGDKWIWRIDRNDEAPDSPWWIRAGIGTPDDDGNHALGIEFNPETSVEEIFGEGGTPTTIRGINSLNGGYVKATPGQFYEMSFRMKLSDWQVPEDWSVLTLNLSLYAYENTSTTKSIFSSTIQLGKIEGYQDIYGEDWVDVSIPIGEIKSDQEFVYLMPYFILRPHANNNADTGFGGTVWIDDLDISEVGYHDVEITCTGEMNKGVKSQIEVFAKARTATGGYIIVNDDTIINGVTLETSNPDVITKPSGLRKIETVTGNGLYAVRAYSNLGGMNGSADISATLTINGITRSGKSTVTASGFKSELMRVNAACEDITVGESGQISVTGYTTDGTDADLSKATIIYAPEDTDIVTVDENGTVTTHNAGETRVKVTVLLGGTGASTYADISVKNDSAIESVTLTGPAAVGYLRDEQLVLVGKLQSGYAANLSDETVIWHIEDEDGNATECVSIDEFNRVFGKTLGETAYIWAEVGALSTDKLAITVVESDLRDVMFNFNSSRTTDAHAINIADDGWEIDFDNSLKPLLESLGENYLMVQTKNVGHKLVLKVNVPYSGYYTPIFWGSAYGQWACGNSDIYLDGTYIGDYSFWLYDGASGTKAPKELRSMYIEAGVRELVFVVSETKEGSRGAYIRPAQLRLKAVDTPPMAKELHVAAENITLGINESVNASASLEMEDGFVYTWQKRHPGGDDLFATVEYSSDNTDVAVVDDAGNITAKAAGSAKITVKASAYGETYTKTIAVNVTEGGASSDSVFDRAEITYRTLVMSLDAGGINLGVEGYDEDELPYDITSAEVAWESSDEEIVTVDNGKVTPVNIGVADITVTVTLPNGTEKSDTVTVSVRNGKTERTYYTDDKIANATENISKYSWAKTSKNAAVTRADKHIELGAEFLWNMVTGEGIPRVTMRGMKDDPNIDYCQYCGVNIRPKYGMRQFIVSPNRPWKVQCPDCKRLFPSNDFEELYELGKDPETGVYSVELALQKNAEMFGGEIGDNVGYLKNTLYPEIGTANHPSTVTFSEWETTEGWGVDNGLGYDTGRVYSNGVKEVYAWIAFYNHWGIWYGPGDGTHAATIYNAMDDLAKAYLYTGDEKYGRLGAIILDRIADVYPDLDLVEWKAMGYNNGGGKYGKATNYIWEASVAERFSLAYDAFFPMYDDPEVISFLKAKQEKYPKIPGDKTTAEGIRTNIENGILRETYESVVDQSIEGNFGMHQATLAIAAVVLDTQPETTEMIDWIFNESNVYDTRYNTGGELYHRFVNEVSRDGQGTESAPGYNRGWIRDTLGAANALADYDEFDGMSVWDHPKYYNMFRSYNRMTLVRRGAPPIGDSGRGGGFAALPDDPEAIFYAFRNALERDEKAAVEIAQHIYFLKTAAGSEFGNTHLGIFDKDPENIMQEVEDIVKKYGEWNYDKSTILTGYGLGVLRDGALYKNTGQNSINDTTRDFWVHFGGSKSHNHFDALNIGIEAYGISLTSDHGYPESTGSDPNRDQWVRPTISHNAVVVNEENQLKFTEPGKPLHFDSKDTRVKVIDVDSADSYLETDEYRRTVVMIDYDDEVSYGIDFFKVLGGDDHLYSFHAFTKHEPETSEELDFYVQPEGTYAGIDIPFGEDPWTNTSNADITLQFPDGYTWLYDVRRSQNPTSEFYVDYKIPDWKKFSRNTANMDVHLRMTMLNDFKPDEITLAKGPTVRTPESIAILDELEFMLVRRKGRYLNTLFTTVIEPYNGKRYVVDISDVDVSVKSGTPGKYDVAKAVRVELVDGRVDYVVYAQNKEVTYTVTDAENNVSFDFEGFVGVYTVKKDSGKNVYTYINDGAHIGNDASEAQLTDKVAALKGKVTGFTEDIEFDNFIEVEFDEEYDITADDLADRLFVGEFKGVGNAAFHIQGAEINGKTAVLDIGYVTPITAFEDNSDINGGYKYDLYKGQVFEIPMSYEDNQKPIIEPIDNLTASAGSTVKTTVKATAQDGSEITYSARTLPRGASFNADTATFSWKPSGSQIGDNLVAIDAVDREGRISTVYFTVTVYGATTGAQPSDNKTEDNSGTSSEGAGAAGGGGAAPDNTQSNEGNGETDNVEPGENSSDASGEADSIRFTDLDSHAWAADAINELAENGIIKGTTATTYSPANNITRADFALLLVRAFELESDNNENFADVTVTDYFAPELAIARNTGIVNGIGDNKYAPKNTITRQDMMVIVYRALQKLGVELSSDDVDYPDYGDVALYAQDAIRALITSKLVNGKSGYIAPNDYTTRAEVAVLLKRILEHIK